MNDKQLVVSFGRRCSMLADNHPEKIALILARSDRSETRLTWRELDQAATRYAHLLQQNGVDDRSMVVIGLPNCCEHVAATIGAWKVGACVLPIAPNLPPVERDLILEVAAPTVVLSNWEDMPDSIHVRSLSDLTGLPDEPLPDRVPQPGKANASGGSTGRPKVIVDPAPMAFLPGQFIEAIGRHVGFHSGQVQLVVGPLYHNFPFIFTQIGLFEDQTVIVMEHFDARHAVDLIESHHVQFLGVVPTHMHRLIRFEGLQQRDLSSVEALMHTAAPCPPWLKRAWIDLLGPDRVYEVFGTTEAVGLCVIRGDEWLEHPGSVGRPLRSEIKILDEQGRPLPPGQVGEVFMRPSAGDLLKRGDASTGTYKYKGAPPATSMADGFISVGDMGYLDEEGWFYPVDRRVDMIISGGANIFSAEVEAVLTEHPDVGDAVVVGLPHEEWGRAVHAIVQPRIRGQTLSAVTLDAHCRERLAPYKVPKSYEFLESFPRDPAGKIRRSQLAAERADSDKAIPEAHLP